MDQTGSSRRSRRRAAFRVVAAPVLVLLLGVLASVAIAEQVDTTRRTSRLERTLAEWSGILQAKVDTTGGLVAGASAHHSRLRHDAAGVTDEDLQQFLATSGAQQRHGELTQGLMYVARVDRDLLSQYVARRRLSMSTFEVADGPFRVYPAVLWAASGGTERHGERLDADPERATILADVRNRQEVLMTPPLPGGGGPTLEIFGPVVSARDRHIGWVGTSLSLEDLIATIGEPPRGLAITDNGVPVFGEPVAEDGQAVVQRSTTLDLLGRRWQVSVTDGTVGLDIPSLLAGLSLTVTMALLVAVGQRTRRRLASSVVTVTESRDRYASYLDAIVQNLDVGIIACDADGTIVVSNDTSADMFGAPSTRDAITQWNAERGPDGVPIALEDTPLARVMSGEFVHREQHTRPATDGPEPVWSFSGQPISVHADRVGGVVAIHDVTELVAAEARMTRLAMRDHLTGVANRRRLGIELDTALDDQRAGGAPATVLFMDLDRFKAVNDTAGHHRGDRMLVDVARTLTKASHDGDLVARVGGDEFVLLCRHCPDRQAADQLATDVSEAVRPILSTEELVVVGAGISIGVVMPQDVDSVDDVLRFADLAMYEAKRTDGTAVRVYETGLGTRAAERYDLERRLREALRTSALTVAFQPIVEADDRRITGAEALVRWNDDGRAIPPDDFIPLAEQTGLVVDIDLFVLDRACAALATAGSPNRIGVNFSAGTLALPDLVDRIDEVLSRHGVPADRLCIELTETTLIGVSPVTDAMLHALFDRGVHLALDDFGTGYASLNYLRRFPVTRIKIDRSFVDDLLSSPEDSAIVQGTVLLAKRLSIQTVAEGVETVAQADALTAFGCDHLQGYLLGRPMPLEDLLARTSACVRT